MNTPCIRVCKLKDNTCTGCGRTLEEIKNWRHYSDEQRDAIILRRGDATTEVRE